MFTVRIEMLTHQMVFFPLWPGCAHRVRLSSTRLAICQQRHVVALQKRGDALFEVLPDAILVNILAKDPIKDKDLAALGTVDSYACRTCDMDHSLLKALGNQIVSGIRRSEWRAHANSCHEGQKPNFKDKRTPASSKISPSAAVMLPRDWEVGVVCSTYQL